MVGIDGSTFNSDAACALAFKQTVSNGVNGSSIEDISILSATTLGPSRRQLVDTVANVFTNQQSHVVQVNFTVVVRSGSFTVPLVAFDALSKKLHEFVVSGQFSSSLQSNAYFDGAKSLVKAFAISISAVSYIPITNSVPSSPPTQGAPVPTFSPSPAAPLLAGGAIAGCVLGGLFVLPLLALIAAYLAMRRTLVVSGLPHGFDHHTLYDTFKDVVYVRRAFRSDCYFIEFKDHAAAAQTLVGGTEGGQSIAVKGRRVFLSVSIPFI